MAGISAEKYLGYLTTDVGEESCIAKDVVIKPVSNGFIVEVGCKKFVGKTWKEVSDGLALYWKDPKAAEKKYCK